MTHGRHALRGERHRVAHEYFLDLNASKCLFYATFRSGAWPDCGLGKYVLSIALSRPYRVADRSRESIGVKIGGQNEEIVKVIDSSCLTAMKLHV